MQGMVDNVGRFTKVYIGWPGRVRDARVFVNSSLYKRRQDGTLLLDWKLTISGKEVPLTGVGRSCLPSPFMGDESVSRQW